MRARGWLVVVGVLLLALAGLSLLTRGRHATSERPTSRDVRSERRSSAQHQKISLPGRPASYGGTAASFYVGAVPAPRAHDDWESSQSFSGQAGERIRTYLGTHKPFMESTHTGEGRSSDWATAMEAILRQRFSGAVLDGAGLGQMALESVDCRTSICRVDVTYPADLEARVPADEDRSNLDFLGRTSVVGTDGPIERLLLQTGPLAHTLGLVPGRRRGEAGLVTRGLVLIFSRQEIDPSRYLPWVREVHANWRAASPARSDGATPGR